MASHRASSCISSRRWDFSISDTCDCKSFHAGDSEIAIAAQFLNNAATTTTTPPPQHNASTHSQLQPQAELAKPHNPGIQNLEFEGGIRGIVPGEKEGEDFNDRR